MTATSHVPNRSTIANELKEIGELIQIRRDFLGLTLVEASTRAGISTSVMARIEKGSAVKSDSLVQTMQGLGLSFAARANDRTGPVNRPAGQARDDLNGSPATNSDS